MSSVFRARRLMACLKGSNLNLLPSRFARPEETPLLLKGLLAQLSEALPGQDLIVAAFWPVVALRDAGSAH